jgi:cytochrome c-type biogenesis protein CcmH
MKRFSRVSLLALLVPAVLAAALATTLGAAPAGPALAQDGGSRPVTDDEVNAIAKQLYCPVCENIPLDVCGTQACEQWRELIRLKLSEGQSEEQIKQYFVDQYGERVLGTRHWWVYALPPAALLIGAFVLYRAFQTWKRPAPSFSTAGGPAGPAPGPGDTDEYIRRLEEELRKR